MEAEVERARLVLRRTDVDRRERVRRMLTLRPLARLLRRTTHDRKLSGTPSVQQDNIRGELKKFLGLEPEYNYMFTCWRNTLGETTLEVDGVTTHLSVQLHNDFIIGRYVHAAYAMLLLLRTFVRPLASVARKLREEE